MLKKKINVNAIWGGNSYNTFINIFKEKDFKIFELLAETLTIFVDEEDFNEFCNNLDENIDLHGSIQDFINTKCYDAYYYKDELVVKEPSETLDSLYRY